MKVAIVSCAWPPEPIVSSRTSADVAAALRDAGHDVTVVCPFPSRPGGVVHAGYRRRWRTTSAEPGLTTIRCFSTVSRRSTLASRFAENVTFGVTAALALWRLPKPDVVYLNTWPLFATALAVLAATRRGAPCVVSVQDVYPESLVMQRRRGAPVVAGALRAIDRWIARRARAVIVLSQGFAALYRDDRGVPEARIHVVPNWLAPESITAVDPSPIRARFGVGDDDVLLVYGGNIGVSAEQLIEAFATIADPRVHLLLAGDGAAAPACERRARELDRVHVLRPWKEEDTSAVLSAADVFVLPTSGQQSVTSVPSKLIAYLLAARPVIAAVEARSEVARVLHEAEAGWVVPPDELAPAISRAASTPRQERHALGARGRAYALEHFTTNACVPRVLEILCR